MPCFHFARVAVCFLFFFEALQNLEDPPGGLKRSAPPPPSWVFLQGLGSPWVVASASAPVGRVKQACRGPWEPRVAHSNN